jgi:hypothetical protein
MRVAYLTRDVVNEALARQLADECGITLYPLEPRDPLPDAPLDGLVYDLNYLPDGLGQRVLTELLAGPAPGVAGVHSYNFVDGQANTLARHGVVVSRCLDAALFQELRGPARWGRVRARLRACQEVTGTCRIGAFLAVLRSGAGARDMGT